MSQSTEHEQETFEVQLAVYDLSQGSARALSASLLGPEHAIDLVPHTGVVVYGNEYYFGAGGGVVWTSCGSSMINMNMNMTPVTMLSMGRTRVTRSDFEGWCRQQSREDRGQFAGSRYDLFQNNCNHFSQHALTEGLGLGPDVRVPHWIMDVPRRVLSSPMGQMLRPMMEQMQVPSTPNPTNNPTANSTNPWGSTSSSNSNSSHSSSSNNSNLNTAPLLSPSSSSSSSFATTNPWATNTNNPTSTNNQHRPPSSSSSSSTSMSTTAKRYSKEEEEHICKVLSFFVNHPEGPQQYRFQV